MSPAETTIQTYFDAIRRQDVDTWVACFAPQAQVRDPADAPPRVGEAAHRAFFNGISPLFTELNFRTERVIPRGAGIGVYFRAHCVAHKGRAVDLDGIDCFAFDPAGKILSLTAYWDPEPLLAAAHGQPVLAAAGNRENLGSA
jgi:steroid delta-isomerase